LIQSYTIKDLMVPLSEYATVHEDASLKQAVLALEKAQEAFDQTRYRHRALLVINDDNHVIGKINQIDILKALEPKYEKIGIQKGMASYGFGKKFMRSLREQFQLWSDPLQNVRQRADEVKARDFMYTPSEGEYVKLSDSMDVAIHRLVMGQHQSLLVTSGQKIVGILRLTDVFMDIFTLLFSEDQE